MVGQEVGSPAAKGLGQAGELGAGVGCGAPGDGGVEGGLREIGVVGGVHRADLLLGDPRISHLIVGVAGFEGGVDAFPAAFVKALRAHEQQAADVVERVALPAPMLEGVLLDALTAAGDRGVGEAHDVEGSTTTVTPANGEASPLIGLGFVTADR